MRPGPLLRGPQKWKAFERLMTLELADCSSHLAFERRSAMFAHHSYRLLALTIFSFALLVACDHKPSPSPKAGQAEAKGSQISVTVNGKGPITISTPTSEFDVLPSGYVQGYLLKNGKKLTLDEPPAGPGFGASVVSGATNVAFDLDLAQAKVSEAQGKLGRGKRVEIT